MRHLSSGLLLTTLTLMGFGLVQVYSSSYIFAIETYSDGLYFFKKQLLFSVFALINLIFWAQIPFEKLKKWGFVLWFIGFICAVAVFVPGLGVRVGGALRWLQLPGGFRFEPSELLKVAYPVVIGSLLLKKESPFHRVHGVIQALILISPFLLLLKQPDFGSFAILTIVTFAIAFSYGLKWKWIFSFVSLLGVAFYFLVMNVPYRRSRVLAFLDPWSDAEQKGFQSIQSMLSFHSGGILGSGVGQGQGKLFFLPEAHTDFTLAVFGEEMGLVGFMILLLAYGYIVFRCLQIAARSDDHFVRASSVGLGTVFGVSVFINVGVVIGLLPTKGLTLPFLSYGGSSLLAVTTLIGIMLNFENRVCPRWDELKSKQFGRHL